MTMEKKMIKPKDAVRRAFENNVVIPAFNVPYLPMVKPVIEAIVDENSVAMIQVARVEWEKFESVSLEAVANEYEKHKNDSHTMLHLDHVPVIDEDFQTVDFLPIIKRALAAGYQSVMVDGSRLGLDENIHATRQVAELVHESGIPCEAELGSVMGHEAVPIMSYEEIIRTKTGFTQEAEAEIFAKESMCDWLSVAVGNIHGAVAEATRHLKKAEAHLDIGHIEALRKATNMPLVLHGGSGVSVDSFAKSVKAGIAKINVGTEIRQAYEQAFESSGSVEEAQEAVYKRTRELITGFLSVKNTRSLLFPEGN